MPRSRALDISVVTWPQCRSHTRAPCCCSCCVYACLCVRALEHAASPLERQERRTTATSEPSCFCLQWNSSGNKLVFRMPSCTPHGGASRMSPMGVSTSLERSVVALSGACNLGIRSCAGQVVGARYTLKSDLSLQEETSDSEEALKRALGLQHQSRSKGLARSGLCLRASPPTSQSLMGHFQCARRLPSP